LDVNLDPGRNAHGRVALSSGKWMNALPLLIGNDRPR